MKKVVLATVLALSAATAFAQSNNTAGFQDPSKPAVEQKAPKPPKGERGDKGPRHEGRGGFINSDQPVSKVADAGNWKDDQFVVLEGHIVEQVGKDDFTFKDDSGSIQIEVKRHAWGGETITPNDRVKLYAEVDKSWNKTEVEAKRVEKLK